MERTQQLHATHRATWMAGGFILLATIIFSEPGSASTVVVKQNKHVYVAPPTVVSPNEPITVTSNPNVYHGYLYRHNYYGGSVHGYHGGVNRNGGVNRVGRR